MAALQQRWHVLVVDDEVEVRDLLGEYFTLHGLQVSFAADAAVARSLLAAQTFDIAVVDLTMPGENGLALARFIRERFDIGIVMLTAVDDPIDRVVGMEVGADDYVTKPFLPRELLARVHSVLRRFGKRSPDADADAPPAKASIGRYRLSLATQTLIDRDGTVLRITPRELALLQAFLGHPNQSLSRMRLIGLAGPGHDGMSERSIDIHIARLRRKIEPNPAQPQLIRTVRDSGYMFVPGAAEDAG